MIVSVIDCCYYVDMLGECLVLKAIVKGEYCKCLFRAN